jgi:hypothetical protein
LAGLVLFWSRQTLLLVRWCCLSLRSFANS